MVQNYQHNGQKAGRCIKVTRKRKPNNVKCMNTRSLHVLPLMDGALAT